MTTTPLIALISATPAAIKPAELAIRTAIPAARIWNLLDDRLLVDAQEVGGVNEELRERMVRLIRYALDAGAEGILLTCSQYGAVARAIAVSEPNVPILAPDDAAFQAVADGDFQRVLILASLESALADTTDRLGALLNRSGTTELIGRVTSEAVAAAGRGDAQTLAEILGGAIRESGQVDAVLLAQYSLSIAQSKLEEQLGLPVFAGPNLAAELLASELKTP